MTLPITLILPTRNAMGTIESHLLAIQDLLRQVEQIVVVDSSDDGTLDFLRQELAGFPAQFFPRPRGLYESWNFAVQQATAEFVYFSTMGDTTSLEGLAHLLDVAEKTSADIVLSPPEMRSESGEVQTEVSWPIHALCQLMKPEEVQVFTPVEAFLHSVSFLPATILGSSASNLYRRRFMVENPFPEAWGHCADSAWMVSSAMKARMAATSRTVACFVLHAKEASAGASHLPTSEHYEDFFKRAHRTLEEATLSVSDRVILSSWVTGIQTRYESVSKSMEARNRRLHHYEGKITHLTKRVDILQARTTEYEGKIRESNDKIIGLRRQVWSYELAHRSVIRLIALYFAAKREQLQKLLVRMRGESKSSEEKSAHP